MDKRIILSKLQALYPGKKIICIPEDNPKEILCEIEPSNKHPEYSTAIAVIQQSLKHYHVFTTEIYEIIKGTLTLTVEGKEILLQKNQSYTVQPNQKHSAKGSNAWVKVISRPGWTKEDHILASNN